MLRKTLALGVCLFILAGCSTSPPPTQSQAITQTQQPSDNKSAKNKSVQQERPQLAEDGEKETRRQSIAAKITPLEQEMKLLGEKMLGRQQKLSKIELQNSQLTTDLETHNRNVNAFMMKYKTEVACIGAFGASFSRSQTHCGAGK
jgi:chemotaxis protein histidine kinase CheA